MVKRMLAMAMAAVLALSVCACGGKEGTASKDDMSEQVNLVWVLPLDEPAGYPEVIEEVNKYLLEKINATLEIQFIQPGDFVTKANMMLASQDDSWDLMFTSNWQNPYEDNALKGGYYDLTEILQSETPELYNYFDKMYWEGLELNNQIFAVPMYQVMYQQYGMWFKKDYVEKYDLMDEVDSFDSYEELEAIYDVIHENEPEVQTVSTLTQGLFDLGGTVVKAGFEIIDGEVTDRRDDFLPEYHVARRWYQKGITVQDVVFDENPYLKAGRLFSRFNRHLPGVEAKLQLAHGYEFVARPTTDMLLRRQEMQSALTAINRVSKNPVRALKLLELMTTDQYLFNLMAYGIEGVNYTKDGNRIEQTENSYYIPEFRIGNQLLAYLMPGYEEGVWEETDRLNREAPVDENIGFVFDVTPVETEITNLTSVVEFSSALKRGVAEDVDATFQKHLEKRELAGAQKVKEEIERQYAEWKATQE